MKFLEMGLDPSPPPLAPRPRRDTPYDLAGAGQPLVILLYICVYILRATPYDLAIYMYIYMCVYLASQPLRSCGRRATSYDLAPDALERPLDLYI